MAEHLFVKGGHIKDAVEMYTAAGHWEEAHKVSMDTLQHSFKYSVFQSHFKENLPGIDI